MEHNQMPIEPVPQKIVEKKVGGRPKTRTEEDKKAQLRKASANFYKKHTEQKKQERRHNYNQTNGIDPNRVRIQCPYIRRDGSQCPTTTFNQYCSDHTPKRAVNPP
jgi:predicted metal-dependent hydrolase